MERSEQTGDQRLSASKIFALRLAGEIRKGIRRDQRLSASKIFAPGLGRPTRHRLRVINAFRHQRFLHQLCGAKTFSARRSDQRLSASKIFAPAGRQGPGWG